MAVARHLLVCYSILNCRLCVEQIFFLKNLFSFVEFRNRYFTIAFSFTKREMGGGEEEEQADIEFHQLHMKEEVT